MLFELEASALGDMGVAVNIVRALGLVLASVASRVLVLASGLNNLVKDEILGVYR